jgi:hypothetical protein
MEARDLYWSKAPKLHGSDTTPRSFAISDQLIDFIDGFVGEDSRTLETGAGVSTILFALKRTKHICIAPAPAEVARIREFCRANGISTNQIEFILEPSEVALPRLLAGPLDLVLVDGNHGFLTPMVDTFFTADRIPVGGMLILDDTQLYPVHILKQFLMREPEWRTELNLWPRSVVFRRVKEGTIAKNALAQPFVIEQSVELLYPDHLEMIRSYVKPETMAEIVERLDRAREQPALQRNEHEPLAAGGATE